MRFIVTGGAGFIGSHLVEKLVSVGNHVICVDDLSTGCIDHLPESNLIEFINKKIQDINIDNLSSDINGIFHLAAQASVPISIDNYFESSSNNLLATLKVWDVAKKLNIPISYASSSAIYGNLPLGDDESNKYDILSPYAQDKLTMEDYAKLCWSIYKTPSIGLRLFNVYGPRQDPSNPYSGVISIFIDKLMKNKSVIVNGGYQTRDFIHVTDIVDVIIESMETLFQKKIIEIMNVGTGSSNNIDQLLNMIAEIMQVVPDVILKKLPAGDPEKSSGTYKKLMSDLNIDISQFIKLNDGLVNTIEYFKEIQNQ